VPLPALLLVLAAACLHAGYILAIKQAEDKNLFTFWALAAGAVLFLPVLLFQPALPARIWPYAILSGFLEVVYILILVKAYKLGDFSLVYPILRGAAPAFLALLAFLFLGERPSPAGWLGLALLFIGLLIVGGGGIYAQIRKNPQHIAPPAIGVALFGALLIACYSTVDGAAVHLASPSAYTILALNLTWIFAAPPILIHYGPRQTIAVARSHWKRIAVVGFLMTFTYTLVLTAYSIGRVSYAGALRESSVVLGALAGWLWLGEDFGLLRTLGAILIAAGIVVIAVMG
jgi:drug/metabolite transporter (DMT)-like permease